ncbi:MAG: hypothetical protein ACK2UW_03535 [Anaerolineales bacterium]
MKPKTIIFTAVLLLTACSPAAIPVPTVVPTPTPQPCSVQAAAYLNESHKLYNHMIEKTELASSTAQLVFMEMALAPIIDELQNIKFEVEALEYPPCARELQRYLVSTMEFNINFFLSYLRDESIETIENWDYNYKLNLDKYIQERERILNEQ